jgi:uncharacterized protein with HEPN domain
MDLKNRDRVYIAHMLECIERVFEYCDGNQENFRSSRLIQDAVIRNLQTMAESAGRLSDESKKLAPDLPWRAIAGFRNVVVHDYLGLDLDAIWLVVENHLDPLKIGLKKIGIQIQDGNADS